MKKRAKEKAPEKFGGGARAQAIKVPPAEMVAFSALNRAAYNPRVMPPEKMRALKQSLRQHGLVLNLVVQRRADDGSAGVLVGGHQRIDAVEQIAREDGLALPEQVPAVVLDITDAEAKKLNVALNKIEGEFDPYKLGEVFASIRDELTIEDVEMTGFTMEEVDLAVALAAPVDDQIAAIEGDLNNGDLGAFAKSITLTVEFDTVAQRDEAKKRLKELAIEGKCKAGKLIIDALKASSLSKPRSKKKKAA